MPFKKGTSGNPMGRKPIIHPEVQKAIEANKNAMKIQIISGLEGKLEAWIEEIIFKGIENGDVAALKMLLELALGKMVTEEPEFAISEEETHLIIEYRKMKSERRGNKESAVS